MVQFLSISVSVLILISAVILSSLVPGGPIENRKFGRYKTSSLAVFNIFLTLLSLSSFAVIYFTLTQSKWAFLVAAIQGISYFLVYLIDLAKLFPVSDDEMSSLLKGMEITGLIVAVPLTLLSLITRSQLQEKSMTLTLTPGIMVVIGSMLFLAVGIVIFATKSVKKK